MSSVNRAEEFVYQICKKSFLSLWSYPNPIGKKGNELCDILVVCDPDIIMFSVKDIKIPDSGDLATDWQRWHKRAIEESCQQLYGAARWVESATHVIRKDGTLGLPFPPKSDRHIHLISVALGGERKVPKSSGDLDNKGYVHVFDEISLLNVFSELDTISDLVEYLTAKENLSSTSIVVDGGGEEDVLACYIFQNRSFPTASLLIIDDTLWNGLINETQYQAKKEADKISYIWDELVEKFCEDVIDNDLEFGFAYTLNDAELAIRVMAREGRFERRVLGKAIVEFLKDDASRARYIPSPSGVNYVFLSTYDEERKYIIAELAARCFVIRGLIPETSIVVGIAVERSKIKQGFALDLFYMNKNIWTEEDQVQLVYLQQELGFFKAGRPKTFHENEYPT